MKRKQIFPVIRSPLCRSLCHCKLIAAVLATIVQPLHAVQKTWLAGNGNWGAGANWSGGTVPQTGDDLIFPSGPAREMINNLTDGRFFRSLTFSNGGNFLSGNGLVVTGYVTATCSSGLSDLAVEIGLAGQIPVTNTVGILFLSGTLKGTGGFTKHGAGMVALSGSTANTYDGLTHVRRGTLRLEKSGNQFAIQGSELRIGDPSDSSGTDRVLYADDNQLRTVVNITINETGLLDLNGFVDDVGNITMDGGRIVTGAGRLEVRGSVTASAIFRFGSGFPPANEYIESSISGQLGLGALSRTFNVIQNPPFGETGTELDVTAEISGSGGIIKTGNGNLRLVGSNSFTGAVTVNAGAIRAEHSAAFGTSAGGVAVNTPGRLMLDDDIFVNGESLTLNNASESAAALASLGGTNTWNGPITLATHAAVDVWNLAGLNLNGVISGLGNLTKLGNGTLGLFGWGQNTFTGTTFVKDGLVLLDRDYGETGIFNSVPHALIIEGGSTVRLLGSFGIASTSPVTVQTSGVLDINNYFQHVGSLEGAGDLRLGNSPGGINEFQVGGNGRSTTFYGVISGSGVPFVKLGNESLTFTANNTYTSATKVQGGLLAINGQQTGSDITVLSGGTLGGTGAVGLLRVGGGGQVSPGGEAPGTLSARSTTFSNHSVLNVEIAGNPPYDQLKVNGTLRLEPNPELVVTLVNGYLPSEGNGFQIVNGNSTITGQFDELPNDGLLTTRNVPFRAHYTGTPGFDVLLFVERPLLALALTALSGGNGNGALDPNECDELKVTISNPHGVQLTGLTATLESHTFGVLITQPESAFPDLGPAGSAANTTPFQIFVSPAVACGARVDLMLTVASQNRGAFTVPISLIVGTAGAPSSFVSSSATPFGQLATLSVPASANRLAKVSVGVFFDPPVVGDLTLDLQSPDGTTVPLYRRTADTHVMGASCANVGLIWFDDSGTALYQPGATPTGGSYRPAGSLADFGSRTRGGVWKLLMGGNQTAGAAAQLQCWKLQLAPAACVTANGPCANCPELPDRTPPLIVCPPAQTKVADVTLRTSVPDYTTKRSAVDGCGAVTLSQSPAPGTQVGLGDHWITLTARDAAGNPAYCGFNLSVIAPGPFGEDRVPFGPGDRVLGSRMQLLPGEPLNSAECWVVYGRDRTVVAGATLQSDVPRGKAGLGVLDGNRVLPCTFIFPHTIHRNPNSEDLNPSRIGAGLTVFYKLIKKIGSSETASEVRQFVMPARLTIGLFGDSYASGEGAPDYEFSLIGPGLGVFVPRWLDVTCHRSKFSGFATAAEELRRSDSRTAFLIKNVTCHGAQVDNGLIHEQGNVQCDSSPPPPTHIQPQITQIHDWLSAADPIYHSDGNRMKLNIAVVHIGGNDIGFAKLVKNYFITPLSDLTSSSAAADREEVQNAIQHSLPKLYTNLFEAFNLKFDYDCTLVAESPNMLRGLLNGEALLCGDLRLLGDCLLAGQGLDPESLNSDFEVGWAEEHILNPLNSVRKETVSHFANWQFVDGIADLSRGHGFCNCHQPFFNTLRQSLRIQWDICGTFHPNRAGYHGAFHPRILAALRGAVQKIRSEYDRQQLSNLASEQLRRVTRFQIARNFSFDPVPLPGFDEISWEQLEQTEEFRRARENVLPFSPADMIPVPIAPEYDTDYENLDHAATLGEYPKIELIRPTANTLVLSWPDWDDGIILETTTALAGGTAWTPVTTPAQSANGVRSVTLSMDGSSRFFRLRRP